MLRLKGIIKHIFTGDDMLDDYKAIIMRFTLMIL